MREKPPSVRDLGSELRAWGWVTTIIGALQGLAAFGVMAGNQLARWFGVAVAGLNGLAMMFFIPAYPFWALVIIAVHVPGPGLCASRNYWMTFGRGSRRSAAAAASARPGRSSMVAPRAVSFSRQTR